MSTCRTVVSITTATPPTTLAERLKAEGELLVIAASHPQPNVQAIVQVIDEWILEMHYAERFSDHDIKRLREAM